MKDAEVEVLRCPSWHPLLPVLRCSGELGHGRLHDSLERPGTVWFDIDPAVNPVLAEQQRWGD